MEQTQNDEVPIKAAAKLVHRRVSYCREIVESGACPALKVGGSAESPRLVVSVSRLRDAIRRKEQYVSKRAEPSDELPTTLHPAVLKARVLRQKLLAKKAV